MNDQVSILNNPIWHSLNTRHARFALGKGRVRRFDPEIGPLAGMIDQSQESWHDLGQLFAPEETAVLFLSESPVIPDAWTTRVYKPMEQMICREKPADAPASSSIESLIAEDVPAMLELTKLTEPGPFRPRTLELGGFLGIRDSGCLPARLAAMTGQRLALTGMTEVSAVCTHPDFRGRGYAKALVAAVASNIHQRGETPILHVLASNIGAIKVYESVGFEIRQTLHVLAVSPPARS